MREIFICFEIICLRNISSWSISLKSFVIIKIRNYSSRSISLKKLGVKKIRNIRVIQLRNHENKKMMSHNFLFSWREASRSKVCQKIKQKPKLKFWLLISNLNLQNLFILKAKCHSETSSTSISVHFAPSFPCNRHSPKMGSSSEDSQKYRSKIPPSNGMDPSKMSWIYQNY